MVDILVSILLLCLSEWVQLASPCCVSSRVSEALFGGGAWIKTNTEDGHKGRNAGKVPPGRAGGGRVPSLRTCWGEGGLRADDTGSFLITLFAFRLSSVAA